MSGEVSSVEGEGVSLIRAQVRLEPAAASARRARRFVAETLAAWGEGTRIELTTLLVSELVTNAVIHARSEVGLAVSKVDAVIHVEVRDGSARPVRVGVFEADSLSGRGVALVDALATRWGVEYDSVGKLVWFELDNSVTSELNSRQAG